jgi:argininosuccinate lyase
MTLTGRIAGVPSAIWHEEVLAPQFAYEVEHLLHHYISIEKVLLLEYRRMGLVDVVGAGVIADRLSVVTADLLRADPHENMSDISFAVERYVAAGPGGSFAAWHVDRSRNDLQVCAQLLAARAQLAAIASDVLGFGEALAAIAARTADLPMPGYTHAQAAQIISPGFYLAALSAETLAVSRRLLHTYDDIDASPLGAGAMAGQELAWDRDRMAALLGFRDTQAHALVAVASRGWALSIATDVSAFGVVLSRFATDLMAWGGSQYGFIELPDELTGVSSAMPQKRNYPILERIRGRSAHLTAYAFDLAIGQRNTPYANSVEVSKEAGTHLRTAIDTLRSTLRLATTVVENVVFRADTMRAACEREYLGGFTLANRLTLSAAVPWRVAQIIAGRYVTAAIAKNLLPAEADSSLLGAIAADAGHPLEDADALMAGVFDVDRGLRAKVSAGSTHPDLVHELLANQGRDYAALARSWHSRTDFVRAAAERVDAELARVDGEADGEADEGSDEGSDWGSDDGPDAGAQA